MFVDFLYSNLTLTAPPGKEDEVYEIKAHRSANHVTGFYAFSPEELADINKFGGIWLGFMGHSWPPVYVSSYIPALNPFHLEIFGSHMLAGQNTPHASVMYLSYLDLNLIFLVADNKHCDFIWKRVDLNLDQSAEFGKDRPLTIWDLEYREGTAGVHSGGKYLFSEELQVLGRYKDLERVKPLGYLYPFLQEEAAQEFLVLTPIPPKPEPKKRIIPLYE